MDQIQHHGVKGQKWGVRKYKDARTEGTTALAGVQYHSKQRYGLHKKAGEAKARVGRATQVKEATGFIKKKANNRLTRQLDNSASKALNKRKLEARAAVKADTKNVNLMNKYANNYSAAVRKASKLPVTVKMNYPGQFAKAAARAVASYKLTGGMVKTSISTKSEKFDRSVYKQKGGRKGQKK